MIYGTTTLNAQEGTLIVRNNKKQIVKHHIGRETSVKTDLGLPPTDLFYTIITTTEADKFIVEQLLHGSQEEELHFTNYYYKKVATGLVGVSRAIAGLWYTDAHFICLDPIPYDSTTDVRMY